MEQEVTVSNGSCMFSALAKQLEIAGLPRTEQQVRSELVAYLKDNATEVCCKKYV